MNRDNPLGNWVYGKQKIMNECMLRTQNYRKPMFPGRVFAYLALCERLKHNIGKTIEKSAINSSNLPFVSKITDEYTPQAAVHVHWSFLKY